MHQRLLRGRRQPDGVSCGASCVVAVPMLLDAATADRLGPEEAWRAAVLAAHREITGVRDPRAPGLLPPWPRRLGTPPWAAARRLRADPGGAWHVSVVRGRRRGDGWADVSAAARSGRPALLCVGTTTVPRHFLLVLPEEAGPDRAAGGQELGEQDPGEQDPGEQEARERLLLWDPARGEVRPVDRAGFLAGEVTGGSFPVPWFLVLDAPARPSSSGQA